MNRISTLLALFALVFVLVPALTSSASAQDAIFPYEYEVRDFDNGLRVVAVPTPYPNIVNVQIAVGTGSRDEVDAG